MYLFSFNKHLFHLHFSINFLKFIKISFFGLDMELKPEPEQEPER